MCVGVGVVRGCVGVHTHTNPQYTHTLDTLQFVVQNVNSIKELMGLPDKTISIEKGPHFSIHAGLTPGRGVEIHVG